MYVEMPVMCVEMFVMCIDRVRDVCRDKEVFVTYVDVLLSFCVISN